jgi:hypothetical protein
MRSIPEPRAAPARRRVFTPLSVVICLALLSAGVAAAVVRNGNERREHRAELAKDAREQRNFSQSPSVDPSPRAMSSPPALAMTLASQQPLSSSTPIAPATEAVSVGLTELDDDSALDAGGVLPVGASGIGQAAVVDAGGDSNTLSKVPARAPEPMGQPCGSAVCSPGKVCCNASCGTCVDPGQKCSQLVCGMSVSPESTLCGSATCNVGEVCCNASCGTCTRPGQTCDTKPCDNAIQYPFSQSCGMSTCNVGSVCCNPSCGICAPPGEPCSQQACN